MRNILKLAAPAIIALVLSAPHARADVTYGFVTVSATRDGIPVDAKAVGEIVLTDAGFASGSVSVRTNIDSTPIYFLDGVVSVTFGTDGFGGSVVGTESFPSFNTDIFLNATVSGVFLVPEFFIGYAGGTEAYIVIEPSFSHLVTIRYSTDDVGRFCWHFTGGSGNCLVTGYFINLAQVPEPGTLSVLSIALSALAALGITRSRRRTQAKKVSLIPRPS